MLIFFLFFLDIPEGTQTLDLIPLLSEDEALVAELVGMEPVQFEHNSTTPLSKSYLIFYQRIIVKFDSFELSQHFSYSRV